MKDIEKLKANIRTRQQKIRDTHIQLNESALRLKKLMPEPSVATILDKYPELLTCLNELIDLVEKATNLE